MGQQAICSTSQVYIYVYAGNNTHIHTHFCHLGDHRCIFTTMVILYPGTRAEEFTASVIVLHRALRSPEKCGIVLCLSTAVQPARYATPCFKPWNSSHRVWTASLCNLPAPSRPELSYRSDFDQNTCLTEICSICIFVLNSSWVPMSPQPPQKKDNVVFKIM